MATVQPNFAEELVDYLVTDGAASAKGTDIFYRHMPAEPDLSPTTMICVKDTGGDPSVYSPVPNVSVQFLVRSNGWLDGRAKAGVIYTIFHAVVGVSLVRYTIQSAVALQLPQDIGQDDQGRYLFSFNIMFLVKQVDDGDDDNGYGGHKDPYDEFEEG
jgi:hypothetical protein